MGASVGDGDLVLEMDSGLQTFVSEDVLAAIPPSTAFNLSLQGHQAFRSSMEGKTMLPEVAQKDGSRRRVVLLENAAQRNPPPPSSPS